MYHDLVLTWAVELATYGIYKKSQPPQGARRSNSIGAQRHEHERCSPATGMEPECGIAVGAQRRPGMVRTAADTLKQAQDESECAAERNHFCHRRETHRSAPVWSNHP